DPPGEPGQPSFDGSLFGPVVMASPERGEEHVLRSVRRIVRRDAELAHAVERERVAPHDALAIGEGRGAHRFPLRALAVVVNATLPRKGGIAAGKPGRARRSRV